MTSPTNEQQRVDVLAAMQSGAKRLRLGVESPLTADMLDQSCIAVAELIEALSECVIDMEATEEFYGKHPRAQEVIAKAKAALANVGGAK